MGPAQSSIGSSCTVTSENRQLFTHPAPWRGPCLYPMYYDFGFTVKTGNRTIIRIYENERRFTRGLDVTPPACPTSQHATAAHSPLRHKTGATPPDRDRSSKTTCTRDEKNDRHRSAPHLGSLRARPHTVPVHGSPVDRSLLARAMHAPVTL